MCEISSLNDNTLIIKSPYLWNCSSNWLWMTLNLFDLGSVRASQKDWEIEPYDWCHLTNNSVNYKIEYCVYDNSHRMIQWFYIHQWLQCIFSRTVLLVPQLYIIHLILRLSNSIIIRHLPLKLSPNSIIIRLICTLFFLVIQKPFVIITSFYLSTFLISYPSIEDSAALIIWELNSLWCARAN